jgi:hypothetical protein
VCQRRNFAPPKSCFDIEYKGTPQSELRVAGQSDWKFPKENRTGEIYFQMIHTAKEWGVTPIEFFRLDAQDKAMMMAYTGIMGKIEAAGAEEQRQQSKKSKRR